MSRWYVTLSLDYQLWLRFKQTCGAKGYIPSRLVDKSMRSWLSRWEKEKLISKNTTNNVK